MAPPPPELLDPNRLIDPQAPTDFTAAPPPGACDIGTLDFTQDCQSAHVVTAGF